MRYHNIEKNSMMNGTGLRSVLFVSHCPHRCSCCQNKETWSKDSGIEFEEKDYIELRDSLNPNYISGLTLSGGDPLSNFNREDVLSLLKRLFEDGVMKDKTVWLYTGYDWEDIRDLEIMKYIDVLVDGKFVSKLANLKYKWAGSTNQRVIDVKKSLKQNKIILFED